VLAEITTTSEFFISEKSIPTTEIEEFAGIVFEISNAWPRAFSLCRLTS